MIAPAHLVGVGAVIGAVCRYAVGESLPDEQFPAGTLAVNVLGSFLLGLVVFAGFERGILQFVGVGFCGAFTTYSSFSFETVRLWETGERVRAGLYAGGTLVLAVAGVGLAALLVSVASL